MKRRAFIALLGSAAAAWPLAARAQQAGGKRRIGVLMNIMSDDPESQIRLAAFAQGLQQLGWIVGQNVSIDTRWGSLRLRRQAWSKALAGAVVDHACLFLDGLYRVDDRTYFSGSV
jgi:hypothetical protein